jgi:hypothetical protein
MSRSRAWRARSGRSGATRRALLALLAAGGSAGGWACGGTAPDQPQLAFIGVYASGSESGRLDLAIDVIDQTELTSHRGDLIGASGRLTGVAAEPLRLTGTYEPTSRVVYLTGGRYVVNGYVEGEHEGASYFEGEFFGPHSAGVHVLLPAPTSRTTILCGSYDGDDAGRWSLVIGPGGEAGVAAASAVRRGAARVLTGRLSGAALELASESDEGWDGATAAGTYDAAAGSAEGQWVENGSSGTWRARASGCGTLP